MDPVDALMGASILVPVLLANLAHESRRDADDFAVALALLNVWALCLAVRWVFREVLALGVGFETWAYAPIDAVFGLFILALFRRRPEPWKLAILMVTGVQFVAHALYGYLALQPVPPGDAVNGGYTFSLNATFLAQVASNSWPGGSFIAVGLGHWLGRRFLHRRVRASGPGG